jgi:integrase
LGKIGIEPKKDAPTFEKAIEDFLKWSNVEHSTQPGTCKRYYFACDCLKKFFGKVKVNRIETKDIEKFIAWRSGQTSKKTKKLIARKTVNFDLFVLKMIFKRLSEAKLIRGNPARQVKQLTEVENAFHVISRDEEKKYLMACPQPLQDVATVMIETGMRCGEVYQLRKQDVNLTQGFVKVAKGKTKSSIRRVHLSDRAQRILSHRMERFDGEYLFPQNDIDGQQAASSIYALHLETVRKLGFDFRLDDWASSVCVRSLRKGEHA